MPSALPQGSLVAPVSRPAKLGCRAIDVIGRVTVDGAPLASNALLDGEHWIELDAGRVDLAASHADDP